MKRTIRFALFSALMLAAPAAFAQPVIHDHRDNGNHYGSERVPAGYGYGVATPAVSGFAPQAPTIGNTLTIRGERFVQGTRVFIGDREMKATITSTRIRFEIPSGTQDGPLLLRVPGVRRDLILGQLDVQKRWADPAFRAWEPVRNEIQLYKLRMENSFEMLQLAREQGREAMIDSIKKQRHAEIDRHERVMERLWNLFLSRR